MFATAGESSPFYAESFAQAGYSVALDEIRERVARKDMRGALGVISGEMADAFTLAGTPDHVRRRIEEYRAAGVKHVALNPSPPGVYFPLFQGHFPEGVEMPPFSFPAYLKVIGDAIDNLGEGG